MTAVGTLFGGFRFGLRRFSEVVAGAIQAVFATVVGIQHPPVRLAATLTRADGSKLRLGHDEHDPRNVLLNINFTTRMPGGYGELTFNLARDPAIDNDDISELDEITVYGPGIETAFEGRVSLVSRDTDAQMLQITCVGNAIELSDDSSAREIYRDIDLTHWNSASVQRQINLTVSSVDCDPPTVETDPTNGFMSVKTGFQGPWSRQHRSEGWYDAHSIPLGKIVADWKIIGATISPADGNWLWLIGSCEDDVATGETNTGDLSTAASGTSTQTAASDGSDKFAYVMIWYAIAAGSSGYDYSMYWRPVTHGRHGLTEHTVNLPDASTVTGYYGHDIQANMIRRWCPGLNFTTGPDGSIEDDYTFAVPHFLLGFDQMETVEDGTLALNQFFLKDWGVYDDKEFFWRTPSQANGRIWQARLDEGAALKLEGEATENLINGMVVTYTDADGNTKTAGPIGSGCNTETTELQDTSSDNPVNAHGIVRKWGSVTVDGKTTAEGAIQIGGRKLDAALIAGRQGSIKMVMSCETSDGGRLPAWACKAGDWVQIADGDTTLRKIIQTTYDHDSRTLTADVDVTPNRVDALIAELGAMSMAI